MSQLSLSSPWRPFTFAQSIWAIFAASIPTGLAGEDQAMFEGYSIGKWVDEDGDGRYDVLEVETRALKGPR
jgi:hypothetical protein